MSEPSDKPQGASSSDGVAKSHAAGLGARPRIVPGSHAAGLGARPRIAPRQPVAAPRDLEAEHHQQAALQILQLALAATPEADRDAAADALELQVKEALRRLNSERPSAAPQGPKDEQLSPAERIAQALFDAAAAASSIAGDKEVTDLFALRRGRERDDVE